MFYVNIYNEGNIPFVNKRGPLYNHPVSPGVYQLLRKFPDIRMELTTVANARAKEEQNQVKTEIKTPEVLTTTDLVKENISNEIIDTETPIEVVPMEEEPKFDIAKLPDLKDMEIKREYEILNNIETPQIIDEPIEDEIIESSEDQDELKEEPVEETIEEVSSEIENEEEADDFLDTVDSNFTEEDFNDFNIETIKEETVAEESKAKKYSIQELDLMTKREMKQILLERGFKFGEYAPKYHDTLEILRNKILETQN